MKKSFLTILFSLFLSIGLKAFWFVDMPTEVKWLKVSPTGYVIVMCDDGLHGIDPAKQAIAWSCPAITGLEADDFENIDGSPLVLLKKPNSSKTWIINSVTGTVLFDSEQYGFEKIAQRQMFIERGIFLVEGTIGSDYLLVCIDVDNGKTLWQKRISEKKSLGIGSSLVFRPKPRIDADGNFLYGTDKRILRINSATGDIMWEKELKSKVRYICLSPDNSFTMVVTGSVSNSMMNSPEENSTGVTMSGNVGSFNIDAFKVADGAAIWPESSKFKSKFSGVMLGEKDFLVYFETGYLLVDYANGKSKWKESPRLAADEIGPLLVTDKGFITATAGYKSNSYINYIAFDGTQIWKKPFLTDNGVQDLRITPKGVFYISSGSTSIIDINTGKSLWINDDYPMMRRISAMCYDQPTDSYYAIGSGILLKVEPSKEKHTTIIQKFAFQGDEVPTTIEKTPQGIFLSSAQNAAMLGEDGKIIYQKYYPAPEVTGLARVALNMASLVALYSTYNNLYSAAKANVYAKAYGSPELQNMSDNYMKRAERSAAVANGVNEMLQHRFTASAATKNRLVMLTTITNDAAQRVSGFVVLDKATGALVKNFEISMKNKSPLFTVDTEENKMYRAIKQSVQCYNLENDPMEWGH
jgi:outer membrane protein assembly factor BamB